MRSERIDLVAPLSRDYRAVVRLIVGGVGGILDFAFDEVDDLQLAVERLLVEAGQTGSVKISFEIGARSVRTRVGPLRETAIADALQGPPPAPGELNLRRVLEAVVDAYSVENAVDGEIFVRLEKLREAR
jgi:hypothetical protein